MWEVGPWGKVKKKDANFCCIQKYVQSEERQDGHVNVNLDMDIFVISEQKNG